MATLQQHPVRVFDCLTFLTDRSTHTNEAVFMVAQPFFRFGSQSGAAKASLCRPNNKLKGSNIIQYREDAKKIRMFGSGAVSIDEQRRGTVL
jgi:hypothetical protein